MFFLDSLLPLTYPGTYRKIGDMACGKRYTVAMDWMLCLAIGRRI